MATKKVRYGNCPVCGKAIVYQSGKYCSPRCEFVDLKRKAEEEELREETEDDAIDREVQLVMATA